MKQVNATVNGTKPEQGAEAESFSPTCYMITLRSDKETRSAEEAKVVVVSIGLETFEQEKPKLTREYFKDIDRHNRGILCTEKGGIRDNELRRRIEIGLQRNYSNFRRKEMLNLN